MSMGWFDDLDDAKAYFTDERLVTTNWDALSTDALKTKAVKSAYNRIYHDSRYSVPTYAAATATQLVKLKIINGEMAYYLAQHMEDEDRRKGLQAQGVIEAGIVQESYDRMASEFTAEHLGNLPVPPFVDALLEDFKTIKVFGMVDIARKEDESVNTKVDDF